VVRGPPHGVLEWVAAVTADDKLQRGRDQMTTADGIRPALEQALAPTDLVLEDVVVTPAGRRRVVKVLVDHDLSEALDASDVLGEQPYTLEVSSPGVGRPLTEPRHFRRNVGRLLTVDHEAGEVTGRVTSASSAEVTLEVPATRATPARTETLPYAGIRRAVVQVEFARPDESKES
jgi:ribosome maturation factor RimP